MATTTATTSATTTATMSSYFSITAHYVMAQNNHFDMDYYLANHLPLIEKFDPECLVRIDVQAVYDEHQPNRLAEVLAAYVYPDEEAFNRSIAMIETPCLADVKNFTDVASTVYVGPCKSFVYCS